MTKKKVMALALASAMTAGVLAGCGSTPATEATTAAGATEAATSAPASTDAADYDGKSVKVWVPEATVDFTNEQIKAFQTANPQYAGVTFTVEAVGEGDAASNMITDVEAGADIFNFAQDQTARLVSAGALEEVNPDYQASVEADNDAGSITAATVGSTMYAYPLTSDNGYFLYYDKSVVKDPSTLEGIISDCEAAGKNFYMEINSGWYQTAFFFGTGCTLTYDSDESGAFVGSDITYASDAGVVALKAMIQLASSSSFQNGSSLSNATNVAAIVDGTWDSETAKQLFGDNYACAKLPTFTGSDGKSYQLSGFSGNKLLGVKPQTDEAKMQICDDLAYYLASGDVQLARFEAVGWGPSNVAAKASEAVQADPALAALAEQLAYAVPQGQYPGDYWSLATGLGDDVISGNVTASSSDADLLAVLTTFQTTAASYAQ